MDYKELFENKTLDELQEMQQALTSFIGAEKGRLEEEKAKKIRSTLTIDSEVFFMVGRGGKAVPKKGRVIQLTEKGLTAETNDGKMTRRYKSLIPKEKAKELGIK